MKTVKRVALETATVHDGKQMIVLSKGKAVELSEHSVAFLEERGLIKASGKKVAEDATEDQPSNAADTTNEGAAPAA